MRQMDAGVAEADAGVRRGEEHGGASGVIGRIGDGAPDVLSGEAKGFEAPEIADGVGALVGRAKDGAFGSRAFGEGDGGVGLDSVAEDVQTTSRGDGGK